MNKDQLKELEQIDNPTKKDENENPTAKKSKVEIPANESPLLTKALEPFRAQIGKPKKGTEKLVNAVIHKRQFDGNGILVSKPYIQFFDEREYKNFLNHPGGFVVEVEIHNPFKK